MKAKKIGKNEFKESLELGFYSEGCREPLNFSEEGNNVRTSVFQKNNLYSNLSMN